MKVYDDNNQGVRKEKNVNYAENYNSVNNCTVLGKRVTVDVTYLISFSPT